MSLGDELLITALGYARSRFAELSGPLLDDAAAFAQALDVNDFEDGAGTVASNLTAAKADLLAAGAAVDVGNIPVAASTRARKASKPNNHTEKRSAATERESSWSIVAKLLTGCVASSARASALTASTSFIGSPAVRTTTFIGK